jgi:hypothetical protein
MIDKKLLGRIPGFRDAVPMVSYHVGDSVHRLCISEHVNCVIYYCYFIGINREGGGGSAVFMRVAPVAEQADGSLPGCFEFPAVWMPHLHREPYRPISINTRYGLAHTEYVT